MMCSDCGLNEIRRDYHSTSLCYDCGRRHAVLMEQEIIDEMDKRKIHKFCGWCGEEINNSEFGGDKVARYMRRGNCCRTCNQKFNDKCKTATSRKYRSSIIKTLFGKMV